MDHQTTGWTFGLSTKSLAEANNELNSARLSTPVQDRKLYRSYLRQRGIGYEWGWILK